MTNSCIYKILNILNRKYYIGQTFNFKNRKWRHKYLLNKNKHDNRYLQRAWNKYGEENFEFSVLEYCEKDKLIEREQWWIDNTKCCNKNFGYNLAPSSKSTLGVKLSEETKLKMSIANKGRKLSLEHIEILRNVNKNKIVSDETKAKQSAIRKGRIITKEWREKLSIAMTGNKNTIRKRDKWPCPDGYYCKCNECKIKRKNIYNVWHRNWIKNAKH